LNLLKHRLRIDHTASHGCSGSSFSVLLARFVAICAFTARTTATWHPMLTVASRNEALDLYLPSVERGENALVHLGMPKTSRE
jgi:hypothetical protein